MYHINTVVSIESINDDKSIYIIVPYQCVASILLQRVFGCGCLRGCCRLIRCRARERRVAADVIFARLMSLMESGAYLAGVTQFTGCD